MIPRGVYPERSRRTRDRLRNPGGVVIARSPAAGRRSNPAFLPLRIVSSLLLLAMTHVIAVLMGCDGGLDRAVKGYRSG